jgi:hypothetical protein
MVCVRVSDLHLMSAMFEVMPEDQTGQGLLAATLRLVDRCVHVFCRVQCRSCGHVFPSALHASHEIT